MNDEFLIQVSGMEYTLVDRASHHLTENYFSYLGAGLDFHHKYIPFRKPD